ncbi:MAG: hypothetical protein JSR62_05985 [Nitrospira sp.]|jgi:hypothetical protein|nr:hypothetical protein [Nitrospira sp.]
MTSLTARSCRPFMIASCLLSVALTGCVWFPAALRTELPMEKRLSVALLPFGFDSEITELSALISTDEVLSAEEEVRQVADTLQEIRADARWLFLSRLATGHQFRFASFEETDALATELGLKPGTIPTAEQLTALRRRLGVDLVVAMNILDYGKVRWQWLATATFADISAETIALGVATAWNPVLIATNVGVEILTNSAIFFGGGYLFGVAFRPVRIEARGFDTASGYPIWQQMEEAFYARNDLKQLAESDRGKKELQLRVNLARAISGMAESLSAQGFTVDEAEAGSAIAQRAIQTE